MMRRGLNIEERKDLRKFDQVRQDIAAQHGLQNPDVLVEVDKLRVTPELNIEIPKLGTFNMTDWAKKQLGTILGVHWDKWFDLKKVSYTQVQEEIQRRFTQQKDIRKIRTSRFREGAPGVPGCDGYIRAVVGPTFHPIDDDRIFDRLEKTFHHDVDDLKFMPNHLSKKASWGNDHCNHYTLVGQPINMGPVNRNHPDEKVRHIYDLADREGLLPDSDLVYPGFHMRNSEVGYTAITVDEFSFRLVCLNGCMITTGESRLLYRQHRPIANEELDSLLKGVFTKVPVRWETTRQNLTKLHDVIIDQPNLVLAEELKKLEAPKKFIDLAIKKYEEEPLGNGYAILQAITRAAQEVDDMDHRFEYEAMGGRVMQRLAARA